MSYKIGVGCLTYNRPKHLELWKKQTIKWKEENIYFVHIADDSSERKGIAYRSNECLRTLKGCDFIFLFNDDVFPIRSGWSDFFINAHKASGQHHFCYLKETPTIKQKECFELGDRQTSHSFDIYSYNNCSGCFLFLTKEVVEKVGAFDERFGKYGFEHSNFSKRVHMAGLNTMGEYLCPAGADEYIYAMDLQNDKDYNHMVGHKPSMSVKETLDCINIGQQHFAKPIEEIYIPL